MLPSISKLCNLTSSFSISFLELGIFKALSHANIYKRNGHDVKTIFTVIFSMVFHHMSWNQFIHSRYNEGSLSKDSIYRFLNSKKFNWRTFQLEISKNAVDLIEPLTDCRRTNVFIVDDTPYDRSRSKKTEMLSKIFDHVTHQYIKGYHLLTLGWSDGSTFIPVDFSFVATVKNLINDISESLDKRTIAYKRRAEAKQKKTDTTVEMVKRALKHEINADYVLMDTWFASPSMFTKMKDINIDALCMLKKTTKHHYVYNGIKFDVKALFDKSMRYGRKERNSQGIISSIIVNINKDIKLKIVYVVNKNDNNQWIAIATTDIRMTNEEIIRIYEYRWSIEIFFKAIKSTFQLEKEFITQSFESLLAHTTIVYTRYIVVSWELRKENDIRTLGKLFMELCDELATSTFMEAMNTLLDIIETVSKEVEDKIQEKIDNMLKQWYQMLPGWLYESLRLSRPI